MIKQIRKRAEGLVGVIPMAFLPNYNTDVARRLVSGADVWLNTPRPPLEASARAA